MTRTLPTLSRRGLLTAAGSLGLTALAVACGSAPSPTPTTAPKPAEAPGAQSAGAKPPAAEPTKPATAPLAAGTLPDIVRTSDNTVVPFKQNKITRDMIPFAQKTNFPYQDFDKSFLDLGMVEGELHMLPRGGDVVVLFVNKKMVQDAGVDIPWKLDPTSSNWTKDDFQKATQRLTVDAKGKRGDEPGFDKENVSVYGAAVSNTWWAVYVPAVLAEGGQFVSPDLSKSMLNSPEA